MSPPHSHHGHAACARRRRATITIVPVERDAARVDRRARADRRLRGRRGGRRLARGLARADVGRRPHGDRRRGARPRAVRPADRARPPSPRASYGYARAEVLAAFVNALAMLALVVFIVVEAVRALLDPAPVAGGMVLVDRRCAASRSISVTAWILSRATRGSMNAHGALLHVLSRPAGLGRGASSRAPSSSATGWTPIDPILSIAGRRC